MGERKGIYGREEGSVIMDERKGTESETETESETVSETETETETEPETEGSQG